MESLRQKKIAFKSPNICKFRTHRFGEYLFAEKDVHNTKLTSFQVNKLEAARFYLENVVVISFRTMKW